MNEMANTTSRGIKLIIGFGNSRFSSTGSVSRLTKRSPFATAFVIIRFSHQYPKTAINTATIALTSQPAYGVVPKYSIGIQF